MLAGELGKYLVRLQNRGVPLVLVRTDDPGAVEAALKVELATLPVYRWDLVQGVGPVTERGRTELERWAQLADLDPRALTQGTRKQPAAVLDAALALPQDSVLLVANAHRYWGDPAPLQALWNLRDVIKQHFAVVVLLAPPGPELPLELRHDVLVLEHDLPSDDGLRRIAQRVLNNAAELGFRPTADDLTEAVVALRGLSDFEAEQLFAVALQKNRIDYPLLRTQAHAQIEQTPGLSIERGAETFADIRGLAAAIEWGERRFSGPLRPAVVVRIEEIEKTFAASGSDSSGTSQDMLQVLLSCAEDFGWSGMVASGVSGTGKSLYSKALARTFGALAMRLDPNATKSKWVGESGERFRAAARVIHAIGGPDVFFIASANAVVNLPPELLRRFRAGVWFFDTPERADKDAMWTLYRGRYGLAEQPRPDDTDWTGSDIRDLCETAYAQGCTLVEAQRYVQPVCVRNRRVLDELRAEASGKFIDAARGGLYQGPAAVRRLGRGNRKTRVEEN